MVKLFTAIMLSGAMLAASAPVASAFSASYTGRNGRTASFVSAPAGNGWHNYTYTGRYGRTYSGTWYSGH